MTGYTRTSIVLGVIAFIICLALAYIGLAWAAGCVLPVAALVGGYVGGTQAKDDPSKTARNTRRGAIAGFIIVALGLIGRLLASLVAPDAAALDVFRDGCLVSVALVVGIVLGGIGGWAYARQQHERQTGYKPT